MAQCVRSDALCDVRGLRGLDDDAVELPGAEGLHGVLAREQPTVAMHHALLPPELPPLAQQDEQIGRKHGVAILAALAPLDAISMRSLSISATFNIDTSATPRPAP